MKWNSAAIPNLVFGWQGLSWSSNVLAHEGVVHEGAHFRTFWQQVLYIRTPSIHRIPAVSPFAIQSTTEYGRAFFHPLDPPAVSHATQKSG